VEFRYPGAERPVLRDISFSAEPGQFTAIVGSTGAGKSTLVNLIPRFYDVTDGQILLDGVDIRDIPVEDLRARISLVPQKAFLFRGTVEENLKWGNENATTEELWHALEIAQAKEFVMDMPGQLQAFIDQAGANVSGGQRQRLSIARALVKKPTFMYLMIVSPLRLQNRIASPFSSSRRTQRCHSDNSCPEGEQYHGCR